MTLRKHTMRDLLSKLDKILLESAENTDANTQGKRKALQDIEKIPAAKDPEIKRAIDAKKAELGQEDPQANKGVSESEYEGMYSPEAIKMGNHFINEFNLTNNIDQQLAIEIVDNCLEGGLTDPTQIRKQVIKYLRRSGAKIQSRKQGVAREDHSTATNMWGRDSYNAYTGGNHGRSVSEGFQIGDEFGISFNEDFEIGSTIVGIVEDGIVIELDDRAFEFLTNEGWTFEDGELTEGVAGPKSCWKGYRKVGTKPGTGKNAGKRVNDCEKISESTGIKWDWKGNDPEQIEIKIDRMPYLLKNTENGVVIHGADIPGTWGSGEAEGSLDFEANLKGDIHWATFDSGSNYGPGEPDDYAVADHLGYVIDEIKKQYGETWEQIKDEAEGGLSIEKEGLDEAEYQGRKVPLGKPMAGDVKKSKVYVKNPQGNVVKVNFGDKKMRIKKSNPGRRKSFRARHNCSNPGPRHKARYWSCRAW
jgi:hypothetical protein